MAENVLLIQSGWEVDLQAIKKEDVESEKEERISTLKIEWNLMRTIGVTIACVGLLLLLYSFMTANDLFGGEFTVNGTFGIRIIFLGCIIGIGGYLTRKGTTLTEDSKFIGVIMKR